MNEATTEGTRTMKDMLAPDETVINPHYMRQLLLYGVRLGREKDLNADQLLHDAEVGERSVDERYVLIYSAQRLVAELKKLET